MKDVLEDETQASGQSESERMSVNRTNQTNAREPIRRQDKRNSREPSKIHCAINSNESSMSENSLIKRLNEKLLLANYFADKTILNRNSKKLQQNCSKPSPVPVARKIPVVLHG